MAFDTKRFPIMRYDPQTPLRSAVMQALGKASMCYDPPPGGRFLSARVMEIGDELCDLLRIGGVTDAHWLDDRDPDR